MHGKRFWSLLLFVGVLTVAVGAFLAFSFGVFLKEDRVGPANYEKVKIGMAREQVEGILGHLSDERDHYEGVSRQEFAAEWKEEMMVATEDDDSKLALGTCEWFGPAYCVTAAFDGEGRVTFKALVRWRRLTAWDRLKRFLHLDKVF